MGDEGADLVKAEAVGGEAFGPNRIGVGVASDPLAGTSLGVRATSASDASSVTVIELLDWDCGPGEEFEVSGEDLGSGDAVLGLGEAGT